jgi:sugar/nucleoside kinase (ribokinase family)
MRRLGVVGLTSVDVVDDGRARVGGAPYYAARALRLLGHPAVVATKFAERERPLLAPLFALGVPVAAKTAAATTRFRIDYDGEARRIEVEALGEAWTEADARGWLAKVLAGVDWLHLGALTRADFAPATIAALAPGRVVSFDGQGLVRPAATGELVVDRDFDPEILTHVDVVKLSEEEAAVLAIGPDERSFRSLPVGEVVLTLGRRGTIVYADGLAEHVPAHPLDGVDPTGAGDAFIAAYLSYRRRRHSPISAARCANDAVRALLSRWPGR